MVESDFYHWLVKLELRDVTLGGFLAAFFFACVLWGSVAGFIFNLFTYVSRCYNRKREIVKEVSRIYALMHFDGHTNVSFFVVFLNLSKRETVKYYDLIKLTLKNLDPNYYGNISYDPFESLDDVLAVCFPKVK